LPRFFRVAFGCRDGSCRRSFRCPSGAVASANAIDDRVIKTTLDARLRKQSIRLFGTYTTVIEGRVLLAGRVVVAGDEARGDARRLDRRGRSQSRQRHPGRGHRRLARRPADFIMRSRLAAILLADASIKDTITPPTSSTASSI